MNTISATYRVVTPMFMSGADHTKAELRLPSIKGALRFWWRALAWERLSGDLAAVRRDEADLFGSADQSVGQAKVLMRLVKPELPDVVGRNVEAFGGQRGAQYLGYGVMNFQGQLSRPCYFDSFEFRIEAICKPNISPAQRDSFIQALKALGLFGALGSKSRKGFGSVVLVKLEHDGKTWRAPDTLKDLREVLASFKATASYPPYTAFSNDSRFVLVQGNDGDSALSLLDRIGREQVRFRSWGNQNTVLNGVPAEQNFHADHDLMEAIAVGRPITIDYPERAAFGLPHNYFFSGTEAKADVKAVDLSNPRDPKSIERRASPLFIHLHQVGATPVALLTFLPSQFLPGNAKIRLEGTLQADVSVDPPQTLWVPLHEFLDRMRNLPRSPSHLERREPFGRAVEV